MITVDTFGVEVNFISRERNKSHINYSDVSTVRKKFNSTQKYFKSLRLVRKTRKAGVSL